MDDRLPTRVCGARFAERSTRSTAATFRPMLSEILAADIWDARGNRGILALILAGPAAVLPRRPTNLAERVVNVGSLGEQSGGPSQRAGQPLAAAHVIDSYPNTRNLVDREEERRRNRRRRGVERSAGKSGRGQRNRADALLAGVCPIFLITFYYRAPKKFRLAGRVCRCPVGVLTMPGARPARRVRGARLRRPKRAPRPLAEANRALSGAAKRLSRPGPRRRKPSHNINIAWHAGKIVCRQDCLKARLSGSRGQRGQPIALPPFDWARRSPKTTVDEVQREQTSDAPARTTARCCPPHIRGALSTCRNR